jgi:hypothetical protein
VGVSDVLCIPVILLRKGYVHDGEDEEEQAVLSGVRRFEKTIQRCLRKWGCIFLLANYLAEDLLKNKMTQSGRDGRAENGFPCGLGV